MCIGYFDLDLDLNSHLQEQQVSELKQQVSSLQNRLNQESAAAGPTAAEERRLRALERENAHLRETQTNIELMKVSILYDHVVQSCVG